jgi:hypothetical protein
MTDILARLTTSVAATTMRARMAPLVLLALAMSGPLAAQELDAAAVRAALLENVGSVVGPGSPGPLALFDERAVPLLGGELRAGVPVAVVAAAPLGRGRIVAFGHDGYLNPDGAHAGLRRLLRNAVRWAGGVERPVVVMLRAGSVSPVIADMAVVRERSAAGLSAAHLVGVNVVVMLPWFDPEWPAAMEVVRRFAEQGGGVVVAGLGWGMLQLRPDLTLRTLPAASLLAAAGMGLGDGALPQGTRPLEPISSPLVNGAVALRELGRGSLPPADAAVAFEAAANALAAAPPSHPLSESAARLAGRAIVAVPTAERPLRPAADPQAALAFRLLTSLGLEPGAAAAAADFPGAVPAAAPRVTDTVTVAPSGGAWASTGLYAAPGEAVRARVLPGPNPPRPSAIRLRVGAHSDELLQLEAWERAPAITRSVPLGAEQVGLRSPFGGLVYVERPPEQAPFRVVIEGAVRAPRFVLGRSRVASWPVESREALAPWGELESGTVILTVQTPLLRALKRPDLVLEAWDRAQAANADLAGWDAGAGRPMRIVFDRQLSAGYMHSGYPIMAPLRAQAAALDPFTLAAAADPGDLWGLLHELGHNHQSRPWTFDGTGEVTVNLFTMFALERAFQSAGPHGDMTAARRVANLRRYFSAGARFDMWQREPFVALVMYRQVIDAFGWEPFRAVFREYRGLSDANGWSDERRRDEWLIRLSRAVARDLGPFFAAWGVPVSAESRAAVAGLPAWLPEADFPARYR